MSSPFFLTDRSQSRKRQDLRNGQSASAKLRPRGDSLENNSGKETWKEKEGIRSMAG